MDQVVSNFILAKAEPERININLDVKNQILASKEKLISQKKNNNNSRKRIIFHTFLLPPGTDAAGGFGIYLAHCIFC